MQFTYSILAFALSALAQNSSAPAAPSSASAPAGATGTNSLVIISPNGNLAYKSGDSIVVTWNINTDDATWKNTDVSFEIADASQGANKVTPIGKTLQGSSKIGDLQLTSSMPAGIPAGSQYCVRAGVKGQNGFVYFFSPNFPINAVLVSSTSTSAPSSTSGPSTTAGQGAVAVATTSNAPPAKTTSSGAERLAVLVVSVAYLMLM
ncbi:hypothetical protein BC830DRAFT_1086923 [Chytriomyces sp. MP71]|nr:hypothetical protein BC830DRAFT_1086923 [Chytriomyces sp. MP71]